MAHSLGSTVLTRTSAATSPITRSATTAAGDTVLVLMLKTVGATDRAGGAPTFNGVAGVQANSTQKAAASPEAGAELWYWTGGIPPATTGGLFIGTANIVIPNTGSLTIFSSAYTGRAGAGFTSLFDGANGANNTAVNPSPGAITSTANGDIFFATTAGGWTTFAPSARAGTSLFETDDGADGGGGQYFLQTTAGAQTMSWTFATSDDWGAVAAAFKEVPLITPAQGGLTLSGLTPAILTSVAIGAGLISLAGPTPVVSNTLAQTPGQAVLRLKGPATPAVITTYIPSQGTLVFTGYAPNLAFTLPVGNGSLSVLGRAPASLDYVDPVPAGALIVSGQAPILAKVIPVGNAALALAGPAPIGSVGLPLGAGSIVLNGPTPSIATTVAVGKGTATFAGQTPVAAVGTPNVITLPVGSLIFKGPAQTVLPVAIGAAGLNITGLAPVMSRTLPVGAAGLSVAGQTLTPAFVVTAGAGSLSFAGPVPAVNGTTSIGAAGLSLTGLAPTANVSGGGAVVIPVPAGSLRLKGPAQTSQVITIGAAGLSLTGRAPTIPLIVTVGAANLALTGQPPNGSAVALIGRGQLALTGQTPTALAGILAQVPAGGLTLTGQYVANVFGGMLPGAMVLTGQAPTIQTSGQIVSAPNAGALSLTGTVTVLARVVPVGSAGLTLAGQAPASAQTLLIPVGQASLSLSGLAATVAKTIPAGQGQLTLAGQAPVVAAGALPVGQGQLAISGPALVIARGVSIGQGQLALTGQAVGNSVFIAVGQGQLTLAGLAPALVGVLRQIPAGGLTLTGQYVANTFGGLATGALVLTGQAPTAQVAGRIIPVGAGGLAISGQAPALTFAGSIAVGQGQLSLSGQAPSALAGLVVPVGQGQLALSGQTPALAKVVPITQGQLALSGQSVFVNGAGVVNVGQGQVVISGAAPSVGLSIAIPTGSLTLAGNGVTLGGPVIVTNGSLVLAGTVPSLAWTQPVNRGAITVTGAAPALLQGLTKVIPSGALTVAGNAVGLGRTYLTTPAAAGLSLTGPAPTHVGFNPAPPIGLASSLGSVRVIGGSVTDRTVGGKVNRIL